MLSQFARGRALKCNVQLQHTPGALLGMQGDRNTPQYNAPTPTAYVKFTQNKVPRVWEAGFSWQNRCGDVTFWDSIHTSFPHKNESWGHIFWHAKAIGGIIMAQGPLSKEGEGAP